MPDRGQGKVPERREEPGGRAGIHGGQSFILPLGKETALLAAEASNSVVLRTIDAVVYATAQERKLTVVTGDRHFKGLPDVEMI